MQKVLSSDRLDLIVCTPSIYRAVLNGEQAIRDHLDVDIAANWSHFGLEPFRYSYRVIQNRPDEMNWWSYLFIYKSKKILIGSGGYKGPPNAYGVVEIGYEIAENFQNQGLATEAAKALINYALLFPEVKKVKAHTLARENPSVNVLKKCGMKFIHTLFDPDDGDLWLWEFER